ncbi:alpha/beta fold hydrolase [Pseudomonas sp. LS44]|uniref:alpha/beta fold hydrolase n=1 Tax=Pseudomonas sp. LS44 TaxID=1357074 RepID=UPI00215B1F8B|nr:alpha/beta fold hydrolase [Pseudomonas sp. LS44]UVE16573.1 alpha/beta fold hydrolase [Pseudomonas sp. LS44]
MPTALSASALTATHALPVAKMPAAAEKLRIQGDGVELAVYRWGNSEGPVLLLVHGYPDNHEVWLPLINELSADYQIISYDVRGFGASQIPRRTQDYRLARLANDLEAVIKALSPDRPVHLVAHDWGSIQTWEAVTEPRIQPLLASYTTISGPCLDHVGHWMRDRLKEKRLASLLKVGSQLLSSWYIGFFHTPWLPEFLWRNGLTRAWPTILARLEGIHDPHPNSTLCSDGQHGVKLYRANFITTMFNPRERYTPVPVQLIVPTRDRFVHPQLFEQLQRWAPNLSRREIRAGHWQLLTEPQQLALWIHEYIEQLGAPAPHA